MKEALEEIKQIRANNNDCWMKLLEIALTNAPEKTLALLSEIRLNDKMITEVIGDIIDDHTPFRP